MKPVVEIRRFPAPGPEPLGLAFDGTTLWIASREAHRLYAVDPATATVRTETETPGAPFGIVADRDTLRVVIGFGYDDDDRYLFRFDPGRGFDEERIPCPELSGVHVAIDGDETLYLSQAHNRAILALDARGAILRRVALDRVPVGMVVCDSIFTLVTGDHTFKNLELTRVDARSETPQVTALASIPFVARGLACDGERYWTGARDTNEIVAFALPH